MPDSGKWVRAGSITADSDTPLKEWPVSPFPKPKSQADCPLLPLPWLFSFFLGGANHAEGFEKNCRIIFCQLVHVFFPGKAGLPAENRTCPAFFLRSLHQERRLPLRWGRLHAEPGVAAPELGLARLRARPKTRGVRGNHSPALLKLPFV